MQRALVMLMYIAIAMPMFSAQCTGVAMPMYPSGRRVSGPHAILNSGARFSTLLMIATDQCRDRRRD